MREVILACETRAIVSPTCLLGKLNLEARFISLRFYSDNSSAEYNNYNFLGSCYTIHTGKYYSQSRTHNNSEDGESFPSYSISSLSLLRLARARVYSARITLEVSRIDRSRDRARNLKIPFACRSPERFGEITTIRPVALARYPRA